MAKVAYLSLHIDTKRKNVLWKENVKNIHFNLGLVNFFESESFEKDFKKNLLISIGSQKDIRASNENI